MSFYVMSDIHGMNYEFQKLLDKVPFTKRDTLVFLGDVIDRGASPYKVVQTIIDLRKSGYNVVTVLGNHEDIFMSHLKRNTTYGGYGPYCYREIRAGYYINSNGGEATLRSYGYKEDLFFEHLPYYKNLKIYHETKNYIFVHGGLRPFIPLNQQQKYDMLWIRSKFINSRYNFGKTVVFGHTVTPFIHRGIGNKIGVDTGAYFGDKLSCLRLPEFKVFSVVPKRSRMRYNREDDWNYLWEMA